MEEVFIRNIIESMSIGLIVINTGGELVSTNSAAENILGFKETDLREKGWAILFFDKKENLAFNQVIVDVIEHQRLNQLRKVPYVKPDGEKLFLSVTSSFIKDSGKPVGVVMLFYDVTEVHDLHEREKDILREKNQVQWEHVESLKHFASSIAHQLRNPLSTIGGFANRMLNNITPECPNANLILSEVKRLEKIVRSVEEFTAISNMIRENVPLPEIIEKVRGDIDKSAAEMKKDIEWDINLKIRNMFVDFGYFGRAVREILMNSLEAFEKNSGKITVKAREKNGSQILEITDTGKGMEKEKISFVFDPFYTTKVTNIGMGLCTAQRIISEHHGTIRLKSVEGRGTTVTISLPQE